jgi:hypothetical protein
MEISQPCTSPRVYYPDYNHLQSTIPPSLPYDEAWHDIRTLLPPSLQEILHHYEFTASLTLATDDPAKTAWHFSIPEMARNHDFLLNCVLSVAALHLGRLHESKEGRRRMNAIAATRMNKALSKYRTELDKVTQDNAAALFASVTLTAVYLFRTSALDIEALRAAIPPDKMHLPRHIVDKMLTCAIRTIHGLRGPMTVLISGWDWVADGTMHSVATRPWWPEECIPATARAIEEDQRLNKVEELWQNTDRQWSEDGAHLSQALQILREVYALVSQLTLPETYPPMTAIPYSIDDTTVGVLTDRGAIFVWATRISREFLQLVEAKDRDALVVLAHYAVLPGRVRNVWWLEGLGADIVTAIAMTLGEEDWELIEWPASVVGLDYQSALSGGKRKDTLEGTLEEMSLEVI